MMAYLWNIIHCETDTMLSWVSFRVESFALRASSVNDMLVLFSLPENAERSLGICRITAHVSATLPQDSILDEL